MNVDLPNTPYEYLDGKTKEILARIQNGILMITEQGLLCFDNIMYDLAYQIHGENCVYCNRNFKEDKKIRTIDHLYPVHFLGPTISNNLRPSCNICNGNKKDMNKTQFEEYLTYDNAIKAKEYYTKCIAYNETIMNSKKYPIPKEWLSKEILENIEIVYRYNKVSLSGKKYEQYNKMFEKSGKCPKMIIVDSNNKLLTGYFAYRYLLSKKVKDNYVIKLENVEVTK